MHTDYLPHFTLSSFGMACIRLARRVSVFGYDLLSAELEAEQITATAPAELLAHLHRDQDRINDSE